MKKSGQEGRLISTVRRIVTGHDGSGKSVFISVGEPPQFHGRPPGPTVFYELWNTAPAPARITAAEDREPNDRVPLRLPPDACGTIIRVVDLHPGHAAKIGNDFVHATLEQKANQDADK
jgi:hypothetical protein